MSKFQFRIGETDTGQAVRLDLETFIETRAAFIANSGGGKSHALRTIIEQSGERVQWIIIDPEGEYSSLRQLFPNMLLVSKDGELPVDLKSSKLLARKVMETRVSTIIDLYGLLDIRSQWVAGFVTALINLPRDLWSPVIVAVDEAHRLAPETPTGNKTERMNLYESRKAIITLADSGRKQSRGSVIASQRVSKMAADARAELRNRFIGLHVQDIDRQRAADDLGFSKAQARELRDLEAGQFYAYGPALNQKGIVKMRFDLPQTKHPKPGTRQKLDVPPASDALRQLVKQMGDLPKQVQDETDALGNARRQIADLEQKLRNRPTVAKVEPTVQRIEVSVFKDGELERFERSVQVYHDAGQHLIGVAKQLLTIGEQVGQVSKEIKTSLTTRRQPIPVRPIPTRREFPVRNAAPTAGDMGLGERKILIAMAQYPEGASRDQLTVLTGYKRSTRDAYILRLAQRGYVDPDSLTATEAGIQALGNDYQPLPTGEALREHWLHRLPAGERAIFETTVQRYPEPIERDILSELTGYKRSTRDAYIQRLMSRRLVEAQTGSKIKAADQLFTE